MTNGEKIKEIFPNLRITMCEFYVQVMGEQYEFSNTYPLKWWNAEYKNDKVDCEYTDCNNCVNHKYCDYESNNSTTKNNLGVDAVSREEVDRLACRYLKEPTDNHVAFYEHFLDLPSVTPIRPKGHWIMTHDYFTGAYESIDYVRCSCCHEDSLEEGNYCPNCGAEMSEVEE